MSRSQLAICLILLGSRPVIADGAVSGCGNICITVATTISVILVLVPFTCCLLAYHARRRRRLREMPHDPSESHMTKEWQAMHPPEDGDFPAVSNAETIFIISPLAERKIRKSIRVRSSKNTGVFRRSAKQGNFANQIIEFLNFPNVHERSIQSNASIVPVTMNEEGRLCGYYEVTLLKVRDECAVVVGYATSPYPPFRLPGTTLYSIGYRSDNGHLFVNDPYDGIAYGSSFSVNDVVGCGYFSVSDDLYSFFYTLNGRYLGTAIVTSAISGAIYACIGATGASSLTVNMGATAFKYQFNDRREERAMSFVSQISAVSLPCPVCNVQLDPSVVDDHLDAHENVRIPKNRTASASISEKGPYLRIDTTHLTPLRAHSDAFVSSPQSPRRLHSGQLSATSIKAEWVDPSHIGNPPSYESLIEQGVIETTEKTVTFALDVKEETSTSAAHPLAQAISIASLPEVMFTEEDVTHGEEN